MKDPTFSRDKIIEKILEVEGLETDGELARKIGVDRQSVSQFRKGKNNKSINCKLLTMILSDVYDKE